ncbi:kinase-like protein [Ceratobasidium sp. AG-I]|nr:kinase-like protein [Ceratobasidium sp. AG-I]
MSKTLRCIRFRYAFPQTQLKAVYSPIGMLLNIRQLIFQSFFNHHPWLLSQFLVSSSTPLEHTLAYFRDIAGIPIVTSKLVRAQGTNGQPIAHGGLADIFRITLEDGSQVAIKRLRQQLENHTEELKRTAHKLGKWSRMNHPNILQFFGLVELHGCLSMVLPWMEYGNVVSVVNKWPTIDRHELCAQLVTAVTYLHSAEVDIVHGNIKGNNVLTDPGGGTIRYMAPELFVDEAVQSRQTDVYALGMTILEIMTGRIPFSEIPFGSVVIKAVTEDRRIPDVSDLHTTPLLPRASLILAILLRCWRYEPDKRITADEVKTMMGFLGPP